MGPTREGERGSGGIAVTVETHVHRARDRIGSERSSVEARQDAFERFADRVADLEPVRPGQDRETPTASGPVTGVAGQAGTSQCGAVRAAFEETVAPHSGDEDEPVLETVREELGEGVALALSPTTTAAFTPRVRDRILAAVRSRRREARVTRLALDREAESVENARETIDGVIEWLTEANERSLTDLGFEALATRHSRLDDQREACAAVAESRQHTLGATRSDGGEVAVDHRRLARSIYEDFPVAYPVLATVARLLAVLADCQRVVRAHLVRRA